ncbi:MAG: hypothetical protein M3Y58_16620 [Chloroflexota bacterium]|nr:hypothetical protein [Chloroflexota bacterium]
MAKRSDAQRSIEGRLKRRGLIAGAAALVIGIVAKQTQDAEPVMATDGSSLLLGQRYTTNNQFATLTGILYTGTGVGPTTGSAFVVSDISTKFGEDYPAMITGLVESTSGAKTGVFGFNGLTAGNGVVGQATGGSGSTGVLGTSKGGTGVIGITTTGLYGVVGNAGTAAGSSGVLGFSGNPAGVAFGSVISGGATVAGYFNGEVHVEGPFYVDPISNKHGVIAQPDGTKRVMYSMEAPESWVEDFGKATLVGGKTTVRLDRDFASIIHTDDYLVFLTACDPNGKGLSVAARRADGFDVQELNGGTSTGEFAYRVTAKPNVGKKVERMPKYAPTFDKEAFKKNARATMATHTASAPEAALPPDLTPIEEE